VAQLRAFGLRDPNPQPQTLHQSTKPSQTSSPKTSTLNESRRIRYRQSTQLGEARPLTHFCPVKGQVSLHPSDVILVLHV
jgi:hypothetical protein